MIRVNLHSGQGLGNQLWLIAAGYCLSLKNITNFKIYSPQYYRGEAIIDLNDFFDETSYHDIENHQKFHECMYYHDKQRSYVFSFDERIKKVKKNISIEGNFQSTDYFFHFENELKNLFTPTKKIIDFSNQFSNFGVLNIRGGEYKRSKSLLLPKFYWENAFRRLKKFHQTTEIICVTDDRDYAKYLFPNLEIISNSIENCYASLLGCKNAVISNSSFPFFPLLLNKNIINIFAPYQWARFKNKENLWFNPCNYYKNWKWIDSNDDIVSHKSCISNLIYTQNYLKKNYQEEFFKLPKEPENIIYLFNIVKKTIKKVLGIFFLKYR